MAGWCTLRIAPEMHQKRGKVYSTFPAYFGHTFKLLFRGNQKIRNKSMFALYGRWEALDGCKILLQVVGTICPPGKPHSVKTKFKLFLGRLSSGGSRDLPESLFECLGAHSDQIPAKVQFLQNGYVLKHPKCLFVRNQSLYGVSLK